MRKFGRKKSNREHMIRNLATSLVLYEVIDTTNAKAKETKSYLEKVISSCKKADLIAIRKAHAIFFDKNAAKKLINELVPRYATKNSGYILSYNLKNRPGDNAPMMRLELADKKVFVDKKAEKIKEDVKETKLITKKSVQPDKKEKTDDK